MAAPDVSTPDVSMPDVSTADVSTPHRVLTALAAGSLLLSSLGPWRTVVARSDLAGTAFGAIFVLLLATIAVAAVATNARLLLAADLAAFVAAVADAAVNFRSAFAGHSRYFYDEGALANIAAHAVAHGTDPYLGRYPAAVVHSPTMLLDGHLADRFGYPPLEPVLAAAVEHLVPGASPTTTLGFVALVVTGVLLLVLLPPSLRPLAVLAVFTISPLPFLAANGYPMMVATPFLVFAIAGWHQMGARGRLGRRAVGQAIALGLAVSTQQYVWFVAPFLLVVLWRMRRGELGGRAAALVAAQVTAIVVGVFVLVDLPFAVADLHAWSAGVLDPLTQHAFFDGPGLGNVTLRVVHGSGALQFYGFAAFALYLALLLAVAYLPHRLAPAAVVLPVVVFWLSMRSQAIYYQQIVPVALIALATTTPADTASARPLSWPRRARVRLLLPVAAAVVSVGCLAVALLRPAPLRVTAERPNRTSVVLDVRLANTSAHGIDPHFSTGLGSRASMFWTVLHGPSRLLAHRSATYLLGAPARTRLELGAHALYVVSDDPQTLSVGRIGTR